jgi:hypothetical protein
MKKLYFLTLLFCSIAFAQQQTVTSSINPPTFEETTSITITINGSSVNESAWEYLEMLCICGHGLMTSMQILLIVLLMVHGLHLMKRTAYVQRRFGYLY